MVVTSTKNGDGDSRYKADVVLLGASNVTRCIGTLVQSSRGMISGRLRFHIACGHGRSFGQYARVFGRGLPGILESGMWQAMDHSRASVETSPPMYALITDVGNDIMYGVAPEQISQWIRECIERLQQHNASVVLTALPMCTIESLQRWRYEVTKALLFPTRSMTFESAKDRARQVNQAIEDIGEQLDVPVVAQQAEWYGIDPIHIRFAQCRKAWHQILSHWPVEAGGHALRAADVWRIWARLHLTPPESRHLFGITQRRAQPAARLRDGSTIGLY